MPLTDYFSLLATNGSFVQVGLPDDGGLSAPVGVMIRKRVNFGGSHIGSPNDIRDMLQVAAEKNVKTWVEERPMKDANQAIQDMDAGKARYRYVLVNEK
jgi:D-arabinose 1-dehydrogenase-like Zn-dependent alcohol dehydrogenase